MSRCYHCGLPARAGFSVELAGEMREFCCAGCSAVAEFIDTAGLGSFYKHRDVLPYEVPDTEKQNLQIYDDAAYQAGFVDSHESGYRLARIQLGGMNCSACAWLIEKRLEQHAAVNSARVNYSQRILSIEWQNEVALLSEILGQIRAMGFQVSPDRPEERKLAYRREGRDLMLRMGVAGIGMMQVGMYAIATYAAGSESGLSNMTEGSRDLMRYASLFIATLVMFYSAQPFFQGAWKALRAFHLSMDVPVTLALGLAYSSSLMATWQGSGEVYFDAVCMFSFFLLVSRYFEFRARSRWALESQKTQLLDQAIRLCPEGEQEIVAANTLRPNDRILVKQGQAVPVDVRLLDTDAELDQAQLTGEFEPQFRTQGDEISSGSVNLGSPIKAEVLRTVDQSALAQIESVVTQAEMHRPRFAGLADQISGYFVGVLLSLSALTFIYWNQFQPEQAFWVALSVLVVGCPCALALATPAALTVLMRHLRRAGVLVQKPQALEAILGIDRVLFDKTGTLTEGQYRLDWIVPLSNRSSESCRQLAAALEVLSDHPLSRAFGQQSGSMAVSDWRYGTGQGIEARLDKELLRIGRKDFVARLAGPLDSQKNVEEKGCQLIYLGSESNWIAAFGLVDSIRPEAASLVDFLREQYPALRLELLSGDPSDAVARVAKDLGLDDWEKGLSPEQKYNRLKQFQNAGEKVLCIGDGVNDAPFLSAADASIALSNAADMSKNKADFVLLCSSLEAVKTLITNARQARKIIAQNICWALGYNLTAIPLAMFGLVPPWLAALGMSVSSALVVLNALRAGRPHPESAQILAGSRVQPC